MACPEGIEPPTTCLEGRCSIQLSYGQIPGRTEPWILPTSALEPGVPEGDQIWTKLPTGSKFSAAHARSRSSVCASDGP